MSRSTADDRLQVRQFNNSLDFLASNPDYVTVTGDTSFTSDIEDELSVAMWVKFNGNLPANSIVGFSGSTVNQNFNFRFNAANQLVIRITSGTANQNVNSAFAPDMFRWYFVGFSYKQGEHIRVFIDDEEKVDSAPVIDLSMTVKDMFLSITGAESTFSSSSINTRICYIKSILRCYKLMTIYIGISL